MRDCRRFPPTRSWWVVKRERKKAMGGRREGGYSPSVAGIRKDGRGPPNLGRKRGRSERNASKRRRVQRAGVRKSCLFRRRRRRRRQRCCWRSGLGREKRGGRKSIRNCRSGSKWVVTGGVMQWGDARDNVDTSRPTG